MPQTTERKYKNLSLNFMNGTARGQINSIHRTREANPDKVKDFIVAVAAKDIRLQGRQLSPASRAKLAELGIELK